MSLLFDLERINIKYRVAILKQSPQFTCAEWSSLSESHRRIHFMQSRQSATAAAWSVRPPACASSCLTASDPLVHPSDYRSPVSDIGIPAIARHCSKKIVNYRMLPQRFRVRMVIDTIFPLLTLISRLSICFRKIK